MVSSRTPAVLLSASLAVTAAFDFGGNNDFAQTSGTVSPDDSSSPASGENGFGNFGSPEQWGSSSEWAPAIGESSGNHGWNPTLECSGSDDVEGSQQVVVTSTEASTNTAETTSSSNTATSTTSSGAVTQALSQSPQTSSVASSSNTVGSTASSVYGDADTMTTTASSNTASTALYSATAISTSSSASTTTTTTTSSGSSSSSGHATFGNITSGSGECIVGNPTEYISTAYVDWIWENRIGPDADLTNTDNWNVMTNYNWIMDHIVHNNGSLNYCIRWDSNTTLSKAVASKFQDVLTRQFKAWNHWLAGYNCWPYDEIDISVIGFAVKEASLLDWTNDSLGTIYAGDLDSDGVAQCSQDCYRFYDNAAASWSDTSSCPGDVFDLSLWPKQGLEGGFGWDWGEEVNLENMLENIDEEELQIIAHEIGHGFGLPDFYEENEIPGTDFPACIMNAGTSMTVTPGDGWMLRRVLEHLKSRYDF